MAKEFGNHSHQRVAAVLHLLLLDGDVGGKFILSATFPEKSQLRTMVPSHGSLANRKYVERY